jgi:hypothetical protein
MAPWSAGKKEDLYMPVTEFQARIAKLLSKNRTFDSYLAGGAALHFEPNSIRFSQDLDYFHDTEVRVFEAFIQDEAILRGDGISITREMMQPGYIRVIVRDGNDASKIEWAHDSAWRFMPTYYLEDRGYTLDPVDLALNKVLALAGRDEVRDFLDVLHAHSHILALPALVWAACAKDPGFTPNSLLELLKRKGKFRPEDFNRLKLTIKLDLTAIKQTWMRALSEADEVIRSLPTEEVGALYFNTKEQKFTLPEMPRSKDIIVHYATKGGVLPRITDE